MRKRSFFAQPLRSHEKSLFGYELTKIFRIVRFSGLLPVVLFSCLKLFSIRIYKEMTERLTLNGTKRNTY